MMKPDDRPGRMPIRSPDDLLAIGQELRARREQLGWALPDIANWLRIRLPYLEALEAGRIGDLPGTAYAVGFLKTYAAALGFEAEEMARRFGPESGGALQRKPDLSFPAPPPDRSIPVSVRVAAGLVVVAIAYVVWFRSTAHQDVASSQHVPPVAEVMPGVIMHGTASPQVAAILPAPGHAPAPRPAGVAPQNAPETPASNQRAPAANAQGPSMTTVPVPPAAGTQPPVAPAAATGQADTPIASSAPAPAQATVPAMQPGAAHADPPGAAQSTPPPAPSVGTPPVSSVPPQQQNGAQPAASNPNAAVGSPSGTQPAIPAATPAAPPATVPVVHATADSWISVRDAQGHVLVQRVLKAGESWAAPVDGAPDTAYRMTFGNAGGISLSVGGTDTGPLGRNGAVLRGLSVSAETIRAGHVVPQAPSASATSGGPPSSPPLRSPTAPAPTQAGSTAAPAPTPPGTPARQGAPAPQP